MTALFDLVVPAKTAPKKPTRARRKPKPVVGNASVDTARGVDDHGRTSWTLTFPAPTSMYSVNSGNQHWRKTAPMHKTWREAMYLYAKAAKLPTGLARVRIDVSLRFPTAGRRDAGNYYTHVVKPCVDGLGPAIDKMRAGKRVTAVGYGLIPDDTAQYLDGPFPTIGEPLRDKAAPFGAVVVTITDLSGGAA